MGAVKGARRHPPIEMPPMIKIWQLFLRTTVINNKIVHQEARAHLIQIFPTNLNV